MTPKKEAWKVQKQWPLAPNSRDSLITRANLARWVTFALKMAFGKCRRVWRVLAKQISKCRRVWQVLAKPLDECWLKQDRLFYAQITYFMCIKWSSLHWLNSPNLPNLCKTCQTCLPRVWRVLAKWFGECRRVWRVQAKLVGECQRVWAKQVGECRWVWQIRHISEKDHFGEFEYSPKMVIFASTRIW